MFLNTLCISDSWIKTITKKVSAGALVLSDNRGKISPRPYVLNPELKNHVMQHINMFPRIESHYTRRDTQREYLEQDLNIRKM